MIPATERPEEATLGGREAGGWPPGRARGGPRGPGRPEAAGGCATRDIRSRRRLAGGSWSKAAGSRGARHTSMKLFKTLCMNFIKFPFNSAALRVGAPRAPRGQTARGRGGQGSGWVTGGCTRPCGVQERAGPGRWASRSWQTLLGGPQGGAPHPPGYGIHEDGRGGLSPTLPQALRLRVTRAPCSGEAKGNMAPAWQRTPAERRAPGNAHPQLHRAQEGVRSGAPRIWLLGRSGPRQRPARESGAGQTEQWALVTTWARVRGRGGRGAAG